MKTTEAMMISTQALLLGPLLEVYVAVVVFFGLYVFCHLGVFLFNWMAIESNYMGRPSEIRTYTGAFFAEFEALPGIKFYFDQNPNLWETFEFCKQSFIHSKD